MEKYKIQNPNAPATRKQRTQLWQNTGESWWSNELATEISKGDASTLIGSIFDHLGKRADNTTYIQNMVRKHTGNVQWNISQLRSWWKKQRKESPVKNSTEENTENTEKAEPTGTPGESKPETETDSQGNESPEVERAREETEKAKRELEKAREEMQKEIEKAKQEAEEARKEAEEAAKKSDVPEYKVEDQEYIKPEFFDEAAAVLKAGVNVIFTGPRGAGKSFTAEQLAKALGKEYYAIPVAGMRRNQLIGTKDILEDGSTKYTPSRIVQGIQKNAVVHFEEGNSMDTDQTLVLNPLLADRRIDTPDGVVECHEGCVFILSANSNGRETDPKYRGAKIQDQSFLDRFGATFKVEYDEKVESKIRQNYRKVGLSQHASDFIKDRINKLRKAIKDVAMPYDASTRRMVYCIRTHLGGVGIERAFELTFINTLTPAEHKKVRQYLQ